MELIKEIEHNLFLAHINFAFEYLAYRDPVVYEDVLKVHEILFKDFIRGPDRTVRSLLLAKKSIRAPFALPGLKRSEWPWTEA